MNKHPADIVSALKALQARQVLELKALLGELDAFRLRAVTRQKALNAENLTLQRLAVELLNAKPSNEESANGVPV